MPNRWKRPSDGKNIKQINNGFSLGKGEVVSSILTGSTRKSL